MLEFICGKVLGIKDRAVILEVGGFGLSLNVPQAQNLLRNSEAKLYSYLHWNQENGPSLFGFQTELEREVFMMIIGCPKMGPSLALNVLSQMPATQFLELIVQQDDRGLSAVNGIGAKKAEQLVVQLKHKVQKLLSSGVVAAESQESFVHWQNVSDVLTSLNYSKVEVTGAMQHLSKKCKGQNYPLDKLIRTALSFLASVK